MDSSRHQDDLEEEVIHRTIPSWSQLRTVLKYAWTGWAIKLQSLKQVWLLSIKFRLVIWTFLKKLKRKKLKLPDKTYKTQEF